jgi:hypothetical protein
LPPSTPGLRHRGYGDEAQDLRHAMRARDEVRAWSGGERRAVPSRAWLGLIHDVCGACRARRIRRSWSG